MRQALFFGLQRMVGSRCGARYAEFLALEKERPAALADLQARRLAEILAHAKASVPFYRERTAGRAAELSSFPVLAKSDLRDHFTDLMTPALRAGYGEGRASSPGYGWTVVKTGGSTGVPTSVIHDADFRDRGRAGRLYLQKLCGFPFGTPYFRLWGSMRDIGEMKESAKQKVARLLAGERLMNAFMMNDATMTAYLGEMRRRNVRHMMAYVDAARQLALFTEKNGGLPRALGTIMSCAGTLTDDTRAILGRVFGARVHNTYGARDCPAIACECERGGFHVMSNLYALETVDENNRPVPPGGTGRILVTMLFNRSFPVIRYEIGDVGSLSGGACECGLPFPLLEKVEGRTVEFLTAADGGYVTPTYVRHLIGVVHDRGLIRKFQLVQEDSRRFLLKLETEPGAGAEALRQNRAGIERDLKAVLGRDAELTVEQADRIPELPSGKFLYTVNRMRPRAPQGA